MSDADATQARQDVDVDVDEIIEHVINANMLSMPYDVYSELFDAVDGLGVEIENLQSDNAKLRELVADMYAVIRRNNSWWDWECKDRKRFADRMHELGIEVEP